MLQRNRIAVWTLAVSLGVFAFGYTFYRVAQPDESGVAQPAPPPTVLAADAEAVIHYLLDDGQVARTEVSPLAADLAGLDLQQLTVARPEWRVISMSTARVVASLPCPTGSGGPGGFVRPVDGVIGIFTGDPAGCHRLREVTDLRVDSLPAEVRDALLPGVPFRDETDLPQILDGLRSAM